MERQALPVVGIDDMSVYVPQLYLPIATLAQERNIEYVKLNKGLGLESMAVADVGEDAATMMANSVRDLLEKNGLEPQQIGRIYLGTESAIDGAKPTATYALQMLTDYFTPKYGSNAFLNCDVVDMTFACIGAVDAMQNTLDWVRSNPDQIGIVVAADNAKYELASTGEYTQGAGAVAILIKADPRLLRFEERWGVGTKAVYDFYKPLRKVKKTDLIAEALHLANRNHVDVGRLVADLQSNLETKGILDSNEMELSVHKETPVFDGPYSNACYQERIRQALDHYRKVNKSEEQATAWDRLVFHLPYAYQARRMFGEIFWEERADTALEEEVGMAPPKETDFEDATTLIKAQTAFWRAVTKTVAYREFVAQKIAKGEWASSLVGNIYTGSIFLALMSTLEQDAADDELVEGGKLGFFAYGSGSKSKVFTASLQPTWKQVVATFGLRQQLAARQAIDYTTYEQLHRGSLAAPVGKTVGRRFVTSANNEEGVRSYELLLTDS